MSEEALSKEGPELFRELLRIYETAEAEDYFDQWRSNWKNDLLRMDIQLIEAHRKEAGAPDAPDLEDVKLPNVPQGMKIPGLGLTKALGATAQVAAGATQALASVAVGRPIDELRLIALFVTKWKMDPTKTKMILAKLTPQRRRYVMKSFSASAAGPGAADELEAFITECEANGDWDAAGGGTPAATPTPAAVVSGLKRPVTPALDPAKRPRLNLPAAAPQPAAVNALAARLAAARGGAAGVRPAGPVGSIRPIRPPGNITVGAKAPAGTLLRNLLSKV